MNFFKEFWSYRDLVRLLVTKDIKLKYRRSVLGYVWSILNPLLIMSVMAVVFSTMFKRNIENFPVYLFCGQLLFNFMNSSTHQAIFSITVNAPLLKKTYVPKYIFTIAKITSGMVDLVFSLGALLIVMLVTRAPFAWTNLLFPLVILQLYVFRDIQYIYNAVTTAWMYLTPIFYPIDALPAQLQWIVKHCNPMYFYVAQFRDLIYLGRLPGWGIVTAGCLTAVVALGIGIFSFFRSQDKFILYI